MRTWGVQTSYLPFRGGLESSCLVRAAHLSSLMDPSKYLQAGEDFSRLTNDFSVIPPLRCQGWPHLMQQEVWLEGWLRLIGKQRRLILDFYGPNCLMFLINWWLKELSVQIAQLRCKLTDLFFNMVAGNLVQPKRKFNVMTELDLSVYCVCR